MRESFTINGLEYSAAMSVTGSFYFDLTGGNSRKGSTYNRKEALTNLYYWDTPVFEDVDLNPYALPVLRKAGDILIKWVYAKKPWRVSFSAATNRKINVYRWLAKKLAKKLPGYRLQEWPEGCFVFYRQLDRSYDAPETLATSAPSFA